jgi:hypothetical protein
MTFPSFTTGEVLTAADMNAVGLWLVKTQTIGSGVATVVVADAFSSQYDAYKIEMTGGAGSGTNALNLQMGSTITGYYWSTVLSRYDGAGVLSGGTSNDTVWKQIGFTSADGHLCTFELQNPFLSKKTGVIGYHYDTRTGGGTGFGITGGHLANTTSYTGFTILAAAGTLTGGTIRVYGYRN